MQRLEEQQRFFGLNIDGGFIDHMGRLQEEMCHICTPQSRPLNLIMKERLQTN
jgi:hypothetical protein